MAKAINRGVAKSISFEELAYFLGVVEQTTFEKIDFDVSRRNNYVQAAHLFLYARNKGTLWDVNEQHAAVMMQMRFDGKIGFPGGLLDSPKETPVAALNRELREEIGLDMNSFSVGQDDHLVSHVCQDKNFVAHFYAKEVTLSEFVNIEMESLKAKDFGGECLGTLRVPLYCLSESDNDVPSPKGLPTFLGNQFAGNARYQLVYALYSCRIMLHQDLAEALKIYGKKFNSSRS